jgi:hypothetical protein
MQGNGRLWSVGEATTVVTTRHPALFPYIRTEESSGSVHLSICAPSLPSFRSLIQRDVCMLTMRYSPTGTLHEVFKT